MIRHESGRRFALITLSDQTDLRLIAYHGVCLCWEGGRVLWVSEVGWSPDTFIIYKIK